MKTEIGNETSRRYAGAALAEVLGISRALSLSIICIAGIVTSAATFWFVHADLARTVTITSGPPGGTFEKNAEKYRTILARNGVTLNILPSQGSVENLRRLANPAVKVDIGFVQGGGSNEINPDNLVSLGSLSSEPLQICYRNDTPIKLLSELAGKRLFIGSNGSGTHALALTLLKINGAISAKTTIREDLDAEAAAKALLAGTIDAIFLMSDSVSFETRLILLRTADIKLFSFTQVDAYTRRFSYLNKMRLPEGSIDFGKNIPAHDVWLIGPTVELLARKDLNPVLSDLLIEAAQEVHGKAGMFQNQGDFPAPIEHEFKISADASRYYKSGKSFLYRHLPFRIASLIDRIFVVFVPMLVVLFSGLRLLPAAYKWYIQRRIHRWYGNLRLLERALYQELTPAQKAELFQQLDEIEEEVKRMKIPAAFVSHVYDLRGHIDYVRKIPGKD